MRLEYLVLLDNEEAFKGTRVKSKGLETNLKMRPSQLQQR